MHVSSAYLARPHTLALRLVGAVTWMVSEYCSACDSRVDLSTKVCNFPQELQSHTGLDDPHPQTPPNPEAPAILFLRSDLIFRSDLKTRSDLKNKIAGASGNDPLLYPSFDMESKQKSWDLPGPHVRESDRVKNACRVTPTPILTSFLTQF